jgi:hypothetical protein
MQAEQIAKLIQQRNEELKLMAEHQLLMLHFKILQKKVKKLEKKCKQNK